MSFLAGTLKRNTRAGASRCTDFQIIDLDEVQNNSCEFNAGQTCVAEVVMTASTLNGGDDQTFAWTANTETVGSSILLLEDDAQTIEAWITGDKETEVTFICTATNVEDGATFTTEKIVVTEHIEVAP
ncbi:MAG: hypothetical protein KAH30_00275 [Caldisericia bacterium]|nr:hypothetical protein [Caldisericia bacterium]